MAAVHGQSLNITFEWTCTYNINCACCFHICSLFQVHNGCRLLQPGQTIKELDLADEFRVDWLKEASEDIETDEEHSIPECVDHEHVGAFVSKLIYGDAIIW